MTHSLDRRRRITNRAAVLVCLLLALLAVAPLASVLWVVASRGWSLVNWTFLHDAPTLSFSPAAGKFLRGGGIGPAVVGTGIVVGLATLLGAPTGILAGLYLSETRGRAAGWVRTAIDSMAGIPSIVAGLVGYAIVAVWIGPSAWAAATALALLMLPTVARTTEEAVRTVAAAQRDAALALGAPEWKTMAKVVIPGAWPGIATGLILGIARVAGETAPLVVTMIAGPLFFQRDPMQSVPTLPALIYDYGRSAQDELQAQSWGAALVLIAAILILNVTVRLLSRRRHGAST